LTKVGVLAFQGDVREHLATLSEIGVAGVPVKTLAGLASVDGLILPGGESTTIAKLSRIFNLFDPIREAIADGLPTFGTCAGLILLADEILDGIEGQETFGGLDVVVRRNAFGHQTESFEIDLEFEGVQGDPMTAAFIRAPIIEKVGPKARALVEWLRDASKTFWESASTQKSPAKRACTNSLCANSSAKQGLPLDLSKPKHWEIFHVRPL
jgi:5'-phosphate synthase pdxT subunit